jgi:hypothetical protein
MQTTFEETQLPTFLKNRRRNQKIFKQAHPLSLRRKNPAFGSRGKRQENLLLFSGFGLVLFAAGMALNNVLS